MPVEFVAAAVLATGYKGPISLEVFNKSLDKPGNAVPAAHATRGIAGLQRLAQAAGALPAFWSGQMETRKAIQQVTQRLQTSSPRL